MGSVQLTLLPTRSRQAEQLQRALDGRLPAPSAGSAVGGYAEVATRLSELVPTTLLRPSPQYRTELHERLVELAVARAATVTPTVTPTTRPTADEEQTARERRPGWLARAGGAR